MWKILLIVSGAGALGGLLNALMGGAGFILPRLTVVGGLHVLAPGFIGNVLAGAVAALISFGLYGPFSTMPILNTGQSSPGATPLPAQLTLATLAGAALIGYSGSRWITAEADKQFNHGTAVVTAQLAEELASAKEPPSAMRTVPTGTPSISSSEIRSLAHTLQTRSPLEVYEEATRLSKVAK
jgi:hypothetical protein